ncbi:LysR substrate-binding domain-containing protein [Pseudoalteromonas spongiae]|uniref:LysR substrate-binding domain-containing protein n=1 Tax=Pseudoalteromonas spongiae TaxID=298657 RepID=UPI00110ADA44|nr:LysR substrate-binding domain-containing protein [Pseudoalteromonas spongiae]TMO88763.1 LysR family transcriptional regulator [Pseudoalteromonas spongiae]
MYQAITIDALKALDAIDKKGSFAAAAESLYKVPSALSYTIKKLEGDIGTPLFDRSKQRAVLTPAGKLVLEHGRQILHSTSKMLDAVNQLESGWEKRLRIARDTVIPEDVIFELLKEFTKRPEQVDIQLSVEALGGGWDALHSKRADIVIGATGELPKGVYRTHKIAELSFIFAVAASHPLAKVTTPLDDDDLKHYPAIVVSDTSTLLPERSTGLFSAKQVINVNSMQAKLAAQLAGIGVGFLPSHIAKPYLANGELVQKECTIPRPKQDLYIAWHKDNQGKAFQWFIERLCQANWQIDTNCIN